MNAAIAREASSRMSDGVPAACEADLGAASPRPTRSRPPKELPTRMIISAVEALENVAVPPAGGCVVSVMVNFDGVTDVLAYPGFHQLFFYGDFKRKLVEFCRLFNIQPLVA